MLDKAIKVIRVEHATKFTDEGGVAKIERWVYKIDRLDGKPLGPFTMEFGMGENQMSHKERKLNEHAAELRAMMPPSTEG